MLTEQEYKKLWEEKAEGTQTDYNNCRFSEDKKKFALDWLTTYSRQPVSFKQPKNIVDDVAIQKIRIIEDLEYRKLCQSWADKIEVYKHLESDENLIKIAMPYVWKSTEPLDEQRWKYIWSVTTRDELILKCNHGSGWNMIISRNMDPRPVIEKVNEWLSLNYAYISGYEAQYEAIKPGYIVEPIIADHPTDYGFWCINGEVKGISLTIKYAKNIEEYIAFVDEHGKKSPWRIGLKPEQDDLSPSQIKRIEEMLPYVKQLAKPFDFVRVDMYYVNGKPIFGETTFTPCSGILDCFTEV